MCCTPTPRWLIVLEAVVDTNTATTNLRALDSPMEKIGRHGPQSNLRYNLRRIGWQGHPANVASWPECEARARLFDCRLAGADRKWLIATSKRLVTRDGTGEAEARASNRDTPKFVLDLAC
jgi:hypothetical protein